MKASRLASNLEGKNIDGWNVTKLLPPPSTGGNFSFQYIVTDNTGKEFFLKALNFYDTFLNVGQDLSIISSLLETYEHERRILDICKSKKFKNVVLAKATGIYKSDGNIIPVPYIIFDIAEGGNLRDFLPVMANDFKLRLYILKEGVKGIRQLHAENLAHQDIKPSNLLVFSSSLAKLGDLGRTVDPKSKLFNCAEHVGDPGYEPIELKYNHHEPDWYNRRIAADVFMLGDLISFTLVGFSYLGTLLTNLAPDHLPEKWGNDFISVLPYLQRAHSITVDQIASAAPPEISADIKSLLNVLCAPHPTDRGHQKNFTTGKSQFELQRVISVLDLMYRKIKFIA